MPKFINAHAGQCFGNYDSEVKVCKKCKISSICKLATKKKINGTKVQ